MEKQEHDPESLEKPDETLALYPGAFVKKPIILWVGAGNFFERVAKEGAFETLISQYEAAITVVDIRSRETIPYLAAHQEIRYFNVSDNKQRKDLLYNRTNEQDPLFTHCYIANWPQAHLLSAVKYSILCAGGDIIITKPLDLNIPMVQDIASGVFPDIQNKILMDDHYRNKGSVRELHRILSRLQDNDMYGKLRGFRMWLVEPTTIEEENRLRALECGVIWDLATHLISLVQLFFTDYPHLALGAYGKGDPGNLSNVRLLVKKVMRIRYIGCDLKDSNAETLAVIEIAVTFDYQTYEGWETGTIDGCLVIGKGASRGVGINEPVKQLDFNFEKDHVSLNLVNGRLLPPFDSFNPKDKDNRTETGFHEPIIELLTHSHRNINKEESITPGRYHCGMLFSQATSNVNLVEEAHRHPSGEKLLRGYRVKDPIRGILDGLVGNEYLSGAWLDVQEWGDFV